MNYVKHFIILNLEKNFLHQFFIDISIVWSENLHCTQNSLESRLVNNSTVNRQLKNVAKHLGIEPPISTHVLRHTYSTRCIESGMRAVALQRLMGHTDISITL